MNFDGMNFKRNKTYGWRRAKEGDVNESGKQISSAYVVIVKMSDCEVVHENGRECYSAKNAPQAVKLGYSLTRMGYGPWRFHTAKTHKFVSGVGNLNPGDQWKSCTVFLINDGRVYTSSIKVRVPSEERLEMATREALEAWDAYNENLQVRVSYGSYAKNLKNAMSKLKELVG